MGSKWFALIFCAIALLPLCSAATIQGTVYDLSLNAVQAVVEINTVPEQRMVTKDGAYRFTVPRGTYRITAEEGVSGGDAAEENITVVDDGTYTIDLFLFPDLDENGIPEEDPDLSAIAEEDQGNVSMGWVLIGTVVVLVIGVGAWWYRNRPQEGHAAPKPDTGALDEVLAVLKAHDGRMTQKELRDKLPYSEAKVSLVIAELEAKGKIEKIKKGRGNILILK